MKYNIISVLGILISLLYVVSFVLLFFLNPIAFKESNNVGFFAFNVSGMEYRPWADYVIYKGIGLLNVLFCICLYKLASGKHLLILAVACLAFVGLIWLSFGLTRYELETRADFLLNYGRVGLLLLSASTALALFYLGKPNHISFLREEKYYIYWLECIGENKISYSNFYCYFRGDSLYSYRHSIY